MKVMTESEIHQVLVEIEEAKQREIAFFARHGFAYEDRGPEATPPHRDWVSVVEKEYNEVVKEQRLMCDSPMARKMFILGWLIRDSQCQSIHTLKQPENGEVG